MMRASESLLHLFWILLPAASIAAFLYFAWWLAHVNRGESRPAHRSVTFESVCGMVLASPLLILVLAEGAEPATPAWARVACLFGAVAFYAIPLAAALGVRIPRWSRWVPAAVAFSVRPLIVLTLVVMYWHWLTAALIVAIGSGMGIVLLAECVVAVRFARAVARRDNLRELAQGPLRLEVA